MEGGPRPGGARTRQRCQRGPFTSRCCHYHFVELCLHAPSLLAAAPPHALLSVTPLVFNLTIPPARPQTRPPMQLPKRLARRLMDLQLLPYIVVTNPHIKRVYNCYFHAFNTLRTFGPIASLADNEHFSQVLRRLVDEHGEGPGVVMVRGDSRGGRAGLAAAPCGGVGLVGTPQGCISSALSQGSSRSEHSSVWSVGSPAPHCTPAHPRLSGALSRGLPPSPPLPTLPCRSAHAGLSGGGAARVPAQADRGRAAGAGRVPGEHAALAHQPPRAGGAAPQPAPFPVGVLCCHCC